MIASLLILIAAASDFGVRPDPCPVPADLPASAGWAYLPPAGGGADLAPPAYRPPEKIAVPLRLYLPPPAPFGSQAELGSATVDLASGQVAFAGGPADATARATPAHPAAEQATPAPEAAPARRECP